MARFCVLACVVLVCAMSAVQGKEESVSDAVAGGLSGKKVPDEKVQTLVKSLHEPIGAKLCEKSVASNGGTCKKPEDIKVLEYKTQVVAGTNYFVKALFPDDQVFHIRIFEQPWSNILEVTDISGPETKESEIKYF